MFSASIFPLYGCYCDLKFAGIFLFKDNLPVPYYIHDILIDFLGFNLYLFLLKYAVTENDSYAKLFESIPRILKWLIHFRGLQVKQLLICMSFVSCCGACFFADGKISWYHLEYKNLLIKKGPYFMLSHQYSLIFTSFIW